MKLIDLTHTFTDKMPVYPGDPEASLQPAASIEKDGYTDHKVEMVMHVGTHLDAPLHMISGGKTIDQINPDKFFGRGVVVDASKVEKIDLSLLDSVEIKEGDVVLIYTGFSHKYRTTQYYENYPPITEGFAQKLVDLKIKIVGMDMLSPDQPPFLTHKILLGNEVLILENLTNLDQLLEIKDFEVIALPAKFKADAASVRVIARLR